MTRFDAILGSAALLGIFLPMRIDGRPHIDGGVVNNSPVSHAIALGADNGDVHSRASGDATDQAGTRS
ncbi:MAG: patatin-like phospholipase family protein [Microbacteriaceae bacterium]